MESAVEMGKFELAMVESWTDVSPLDEYETGELGTDEDLALIPGTVVTSLVDAVAVLSGVCKEEDPPIGMTANTSDVVVPAVVSKPISEWVNASVCPVRV